MAAGGKKMNPEHVDGTDGYNDEIKTNGEAGIRTLETRKGLLVFETSPIDHSGTSPGLTRIRLYRAVTCARATGVSSFETVRGWYADSVYREQQLHSILIKIVGSSTALSLQNRCRCAKNGRRATFYRVAGFG